MIALKVIGVLAFAGMALYDMFALLFGDGQGMTGQKAGYELFGCLVMLLLLEISGQLDKLRK